MIRLVICSIRSAKYEAVCASYARCPAGTTHEVVGDPRFRTVTWQTHRTAAVPELKSTTDIDQVDSERGAASEFMLV